MVDRTGEILEKYDISITETKKGRGGTICDSSLGPLILRQYKGSLERIEYEEELLQRLQQQKVIRVDCPLRNKGKELITKIDDENYILKPWYLGRECDVKQLEDVYEGGKLLATFHNQVNELQLTRSLPREKEPLDVEYGKYNIELKRIRNYLRNKNKRNSFELEIIKSFEGFYELAEEAYGELDKLCKSYEYEKLLKVTHGNYNYHNIVLSKEGNGIINFESSVVQPQVVDLYNYLRKVMEKYQWRADIGISLLECYDSIRPIASFERRLLRVLVAYPEKYRKVVNHYYNSNKALVSQRSVEKLKQVVETQESKTSFILKI